MYRVLIVEDDPMVAMINEKYVNRNKDFTVARIFNDGESVIEYVKNHSVDLIILDIFMKHSNGMELLRNIRMQAVSVDVILATSSIDKVTVCEAMRLGVIDYLVKPYTFERFKAALDRFSAHINMLNSVERINQKSIDCIMNKFVKKNVASPKGIQEKTKRTIVACLQRENRWYSGDEIAASVGLTGVTVRRYMAHLSEMGIVAGRMNYATGGRPCMLYKICE